MRKYLDEEEFYKEEVEQNNAPIEEIFGCGFCWDKRKHQTKELFFLDKANNMRVCSYCPNCGRALGDMNE